MIRRLMRLPRSLRVLLLVALCGLLGVAPAYAYWSLTATTSATVQADTLAVPAAPTVGSPTPTSLTVSGSLPGTQVAGTTYAVKRGATTVCAPSASPYSCTDTGLANGTTYSYTVVATLSAWTATSGATSGTTSCTTPDVFTVGAPATATAGTAFSVTLTAKRCDGAVDTAYTGSKALTWAAVAASPNGDAATLPANATFANGVATVSVTLRAAGSATLTPTSGAVTGSATTTVVAGSPTNLTLTNATSKGVAVTLSCADFGSRYCLASNPGVNGNHAWTATANLFDDWGNPATTATALTVTADPSSGTTAPFTIPAGSGTGTLSVQIANNASVTITVSATGLQTLYVLQAR